MSYRIAMINNLSSKDHRKLLFHSEYIGNVLTKSLGFQTKLHILNMVSDNCNCLRMRGEYSNINTDLEVEYIQL